MQVILFQNVERLGMQGDLVNVAPGFYRNFLGPRGIAVEATESNMRQLEYKRRRLKTEADKQLKEAQGFAQQLQQAKIEFTLKANNDGRLFGSVSERDLAEALEAQGLTVERRQIMLHEPIKTTGTHAVKVRLLGNLETHINVVVIPELTEEAEETRELQARARARKAKAEAEARGETATEEAAPEAASERTNETEAPAEE